MRIITIKGEQNSGKSTLIRNLYQHLTKIKNIKIITYTPAGYDRTDFDAVLSITNKIVVLRSYGDKISYVREGLENANSKNADVFINAWTDSLDEKYDIQKELPNTEISNNPIKIYEPLRIQLSEFLNLIASKI